MYLNEVFHLVKSWGVTPRVCDGVKKKPFKMSQKNIFLIIIKIIY